MYTEVPNSKTWFSIKDGKNIKLIIPEKADSTILLSDCGLARDVLRD